MNGRFSKGWMRGRLILVMLLSTLLVLFLLPMKPSHAFNPKAYTWDGDPTMRVASISFPEDTVWRSDLENGIGRWNGMWGMWLEFDYSFVGDTTYSNGDGQNSVGFVSAEDIDGVWGLTWTRYSGSEILETDVTFNADIGWNTGAQDERVVDTSAPAFRKVVVHEFGHALGLGHYCSELAQMAQGYTGHIYHGGSAVYRHHPTPDDAEGARAQYPFPANSERDAALTNHEMSGACGSQIWRNNSDVTTVSPGDTTDVEYTVENLGNVGINFSAGIYLSTNEYISKYDTYLRGFGYYLPAHFAWERDKTVTIPASVAPGMYYIGVVVDGDNELAEARESNNRLVFPGRWRVAE